MDVIEFGSRLENFVDDWLIEELRDVELRMYSPEPREVVLQYDQPWEGTLSEFWTALQDGERYFLYYRAQPAGEEEENHRFEAACRVRCGAGVRSSINVG